MRAVPEQQPPAGGANHRARGPGGAGSPEENGDATAKPRLLGRRPRDGPAPVQGVSLTCIGLPAEEFFRMVRLAAFDAAELLLSSYVLRLQMGNPFIAVLAFPSRVFGHSGI
jgi:hypothetical protein